MINIISKLFSMPYAALLILIAGVGSLAFAFTLQYGFGVLPCELCLWQRVPFAATAFLALIALLTRPYGRHTRLLLGACALLFTLNSGVAIFHSGVERHWWVWESTCTSSPFEHVSIEDLRQKLLATPVVRCDQISWTLLGLSMANWNVPFSLALALLAIIASVRSRSRVA
jgi:disulfide bond formation protein DsbB